MTSRVAMTECLAGPSMSGGRAGFLARTALCGVLAGMALAGSAQALPLGGSSLVGGGGNPVITQDLGAMAVQLNAPRTVLTWTSYNVSAAETVTYQFGARNWIVLNRVGDFQPLKIDGTIQGKVGSGFGGNIWFQSKGGVIFGPGARVDAGGLLFTTGEANLDHFLDPEQRRIAFAGELLPDTRFLVKSGARINGHGGLVAIVGPSVVSQADTEVNSDGGGGVLFGAANNYTLSFVERLSGDFDLVDFIVPSSGAGSAAKVALDLQNTTRASNVFVSVVSRAGVASAVVNLEGMITAQSATPDGGDIVISGGGGIVGGQPGPRVGLVDTDVYLNKAVASRDLNLKTQGQVYGRPWLRPAPPPEPPPPEPPPEVVDPPPEPPPELCDGQPCGDFVPCDGDCDIGGGDPGDDDPCPPPLGCAPVVRGDEFVLGSLANPGLVSGLTVGRDARLVASRNIDIGRLTVSRDTTIEAPTLFANLLGAGRDLTITVGSDVRISQAVAGRNGAIRGHDVTMDGLLTGGGTVSITAANDILIGDGGSTVSGPGFVNLNAARNVTIAAGDARFGNVTAGADVNLRGGSIRADRITGQRIFGQSEAANIGEAVSAGDIYIFTSQGDAVVGRVTAGDDVFIVAQQGTASLGSALLTNQAADTVLTGFAGNPDTAGNGRIVRVESLGGDARLGLGNGSVAGASSVIVRGGQDVAVDVAADLPGSFQLVAGRDASLRAPTASLSSIQAGRDLSLTATAGDFTSTQALAATRNIAITASGALRLGDVRADAGSITLGGRTVNAGSVTAAQDLILRAPGGAITTASYRAGRDLVVEANTLALGAQLAPVGRDLSVATATDFSSTSDLSVARNFTLSAGGNANVRAISAPNGAIQLAANNLTASGTLSGQTAVNLNLRGSANLASISGGSSQITAASLNVAGPINLQGSLTVDVQGRAVLGQTTAGATRIVARDLDMTAVVTAATLQVESRDGAFRLGGAGGDTAPTSGLWLDNAEFGRLRVAGALNLYAGAMMGAARGDLVVQALDVNPAFTPQLALYAGRNQNVLVQGVAAPTSSGGAVRIGDAADANWRPGSILISGGLGAAAFQGGAYSNVRAFDEVRLAAQQDILMGSLRFIGLVQAASPADIDIGRAQPTGVVPTAGEQFRVFVAAGRLAVSADGKVVQQNTSPSVGAPVGILLSGGQATALIIDPPQLVDLFGAYVATNGKLTTSFAAGSTIPFQVVDANGSAVTPPAGTSYRFNSCNVGTNTCSAAAPSGVGAAANVTQSSPVQSPSALGGSDPAGGNTEDDGGADPATAPADAIGSVPPLLGVAPPSEDQVVADPVTAGAGSEEIWRKSRQKQK